jgi:hypothetical protein
MLDSDLGVKEEEEEEDEGGWASEPEHELDASGAKGSTEASGAKGSTESPAEDFEEAGAGSLSSLLPLPHTVDLGSELRSLPWAHAILEFFQGYRESLGVQVSKLAFSSGCTGMWTEGMVTQVL